MHAVVMDSLEEYLSGTLEPAELRVIEAHLKTCELCREDLLGMRQVSLLFGSMREEEPAAEEVLEPSARFYAGIVEKVHAGKRQPAPSFAGWFGLDFVFGRRLVFASLLTLAACGAYLVSHEAGMANHGISPDAVMAQQNSPGFDSDHAPDNMLVTLTAYEH
jgi:anti-sigma factor RsiW